MQIRRLILRLAVYYAIASVALAIALGEPAFHPQRMPLTETESAKATAARFGANLQDVSITASDRTRLQGWFAHPAKANGNAVALLHGVGDNRQCMLGFAELFLSKGYAVLLPDSRGHGLSDGTPTYGLKESDDVRNWFDWLQTRENPNCVFGIGESMGAAIVLQSVKSTPFCAVVAESPFASFQQIAYIRVGQIFHTGEWLGQYGLRPAVELAFLYGRLTRGVNLARVSPEQRVVGSRVPILLIHGLADNNIPPNQSEMIRAHNPADVALWVVPNAGHGGVISVAPEEFDSRALYWFADHVPLRSRRIMEDNAKREPDARVHRLTPWGTFTPIEALRALHRSIPRREYQNLALVWRYHLRFRPSPRLLLDQHELAARVVLAFSA